MSFHFVAKNNPILSLKAKNLFKTTEPLYFQTVQKLYIHVSGEKNELLVVYSSENLYI